MNFILKNIIAAAVVCLNVFATGNTSPVTHSEVLYKICDAITEKIVQENSHQLISVSLKLDTNSLSEFFRQQFIQSFISRNISVSMETGNTETTLELSVRGSSVYYGEVFTESFLGERKTERTISMNISSVLISPADGKALSAQSYSHSITDTVSYFSINQVAENRMPVSTYHAPTLSFFDALLEPAIVTIASGVAIYLFFTIRS